MLSIVGVFLQKKKNNNAELIQRHDVQFVQMTAFPIMQLANDFRTQSEDPVRDTVNTDPHRESVRRIMSMHPR